VLSFRCKRHGGRGAATPPVALVAGEGLASKRGRGSHHRVKLRKRARGVALVDGGENQKGGYDRVL
jgi:hypothetical protein